MTGLQKLDVPQPDGARGLARSVMEDNLGQLEQEPTVAVSSNTPALEVVGLVKRFRKRTAANERVRFLSRQQNNHRCVRSARARLRGG